MFVFGGETSQGNTNDLFMLNLLNFTWSKVQHKGTPPIERSFHSTAFIPKGSIR